jgi:ABC-type transport system involved in multi-copper enzyme maturation permease subunit
VTQLAWRQLRLPSLLGAALLGAVAIIILITHRQMTSYADRSGLSACLAAHHDCTIAISAFQSRFSIWLALLGSLSFLPMLAGLFLGAPFMAREIEQGTHRLVWTQSISRRRWLTTKLTIVLVGLVLAAATTTVLFTLYAHTWTTVDLADYSRIQPAMFDLQGTVFIASMLAAFGIGLAASAFIGRTVPAMAVAIAGAAAIHLGLRGSATHLVTPNTLTFPFGTRYPRANLGDWFLGENVIDHTGNTITQATLQTICPATNPAGGIRGIDPTCVTAHGYQFHDTYLPLSAFWPLQTVETLILVSLAGVLIGAATWQIIRHTS